MSVGVCTRVKNPDIKHGAFLPAFPKSTRLNVQAGLVGGDCGRSIEYFPSERLQLWFSANVSAHFFKVENNSLELTRIFKESFKDQR